LRTSLPTIQESELLKQDKLIVEDLNLLDIGSGLEGVPFTLFINEVEFVPSLYVDELNPDKYPVVTKIAESLVHIALEYYRYPELPVKVNFD
jgi:hypothetical protein